MGIILGGPKAWKVTKKGNIACAFHWVNKEPAMCLFPVPKRAGGAGFIICLSALHKYANSDGSPTPYLISQAVTAANVMALDTTRATYHLIADVIMLNIPDLVRMPPKPESMTREEENAGAVVGEMSLIQGGRTVAQREVRDAPQIIVPGNGLH